MKDVEIRYWGKLPLSLTDVYTLHIINDDGSETPVYENCKYIGYKIKLCTKETAIEKRNELLNVSGTK